MNEQRPDTVSEYQRRLRLATKWGRPFLVSTILCVIALIALFNMDIFSPSFRGALFTFLLIGAFASWGLHLYFETKYNRCREMRRQTQGIRFHVLIPCSSCCCLIDSLMGTRV